MVTETQQNMLDGLLVAMRAEHEGEHFYRMAAASTSDPKGKEVLAGLAEEEKAHSAFLKNQYNSIVETGKADADMKLGEASILDGPSPIFSDGIRGRLEKAQAEMTILAVGAQLELSASQHYLALAGEADDPVVKRFYTRLSEWEIGHYRALISQQDALQDDYWDKAGFAPF
jgi:rubrerythrin